MKDERWRGYLLGLGAMLAYGVNAPIIREGTQRFGIVLPGLTLALLTGLVTLAPLALRGLSGGSRPAGRGLLLMLGAGLCSAVGIGSYTLALSQLPVSIVTPISSIYPLITLLLARLLLQRSERITWRMAAGVGCVVAGVIVVAFNRG